MTSSIYDRLQQRITIPSHPWTEPGQLRELILTNSNTWPEHLQLDCWTWDIDKPAKPPVYRKYATRVLTPSGPRLVRLKDRDQPRITHQGKFWYVRKLLYTIQLEYWAMIKRSKDTRCPHEKCVNPHHRAFPVQVDDNHQNIVDLSELLGRLMRYNTLEDLQRDVGMAWNLDDYKQAIRYAELENLYNLL